MDTSAWVRQMAGSLAKGQALESFEKDALIVYMDVVVTEEEREYYNKWLYHQDRDAQRRIGDELCAYEVASYARRLCRLMQLRAPGIIIRNEGRNLAAALVLNRFASSRDLVDNSVRLDVEQTDVTHHLRQSELLRKLEEYPYEIFVERKTLSRIVHNLADSQLHIKVDKPGVWYEK